MELLGEDQEAWPYWSGCVTQVGFEAELTSAPGGSVCEFSAVADAMPWLCHLGL